MKIIWIISKIIMASKNLKHYVIEEDKPLSNIDDILNRANYEKLLFDEIKKIHRSDNNNNPFRKVIIILNRMISTFDIMLSEIK